MDLDSTKIWYTVIDHDPSERTKILKINVSLVIYSFVATIMADEVDNGADTEMKEE